MIMRSTESFTEEKEKYTPWGWEVTESVKAEKDTLCRKFLLLLPTHKSLSLPGTLRGWRAQTRLPKESTPAPLAPRYAASHTPRRISVQGRFQCVSDTSPRLLLGGGSARPRTQSRLRGTTSCPSNPDPRRGRRPAGLLPQDLPPPVRGTPAPLGGAG